MNQGLTDQFIRRGRFDCTWVGSLEKVEGILDSESRKGIKRVRKGKEYALKEDDNLHSQ